ncbi:MAG: hypothetical protein HY691_12985 [Chloroflexi bacterium]|nr:hypothetical protein [Chloroflexota bacterium]
MSRERDLVEKIRRSAAEPIGPKELERRKKLFARTLEVRAKIGPISTPTDVLVRSVREGEDEAYG